MLKAKKIYFIVGESSGDFIASNIMYNLKSMSSCEFFGIGGDLMKIQGLDTLFPSSEISIIGFFELIPHFFRIKNLIQRTIKDIMSKNPDLLITVDSQEFNYRVAKKIRCFKPNLKIIQIVAPSVWAYRPKRANSYANLYDYLLTILPFEAPFFRKVGLKCSYIGHPILEQKFYINNKMGLTDSNNKKIICVTLGSRKSEIVRHMPIFTKALNIVSKKIDNLEVMFVIENKFYKEIVLKFLQKNANFIFIFPTDKLRSFASADLALAKSGTNTLEIAASGTSMIVAYKFNILTFILIKLLVKIKWISLINIIAKKSILPEFVQFKCKPELIAESIIEMLLNSQKSSDQVEKSKKALIKLGLNFKFKPSEIAAKIIIKKFL